MTSRVEIWNAALANIGAKALIEDPDEDSNEAVYCRIFYEQALRAVLRDHDWPFARKRVALAGAGDPVDPGWTFMYGFPSDAVAIRSIGPEAVTGIGNAYEIGLSGSAKVILTSASNEATATYTAFISDETLFDPGFVIALGWKLGSLLAAPITGNLDIKKTAETLYRSEASAAWASSAAESRRQPAPESEYIRARD